MAKSVRQQIVISGVGGQGVLFVTRLLAEAAMDRGLHVLTSETHGMAQRGGTVISHFKAGEFHSPLIRSGRADGLIALKSENLAPHAVFLKPGGWAVVNAADGENIDAAGRVFTVDAEALARRINNYKSLNLIVLGFAVAVGEKMKSKASRLFCTLADLEQVVESNLGKRGAQASAFLQALKAGYEARR